MKKNSVLLFLAAFFLGNMPFGFSQDVVIDYEAWNPTNPPCNIFGTGTNVPATIGGSSGSVMHYSKQGQPQYNATQKAIALRTISATSPVTKQGTKFSLSYNFKPGYRYTVNVTLAQSSSTAGYPDGARLRADRTNSAGGPVPAPGLQI